VKPKEFRVAVGSGEVTALDYGKAGAPGAAFLLAHGAGAGQRHPYMVGLAERLTDRGLPVVTFDFPYTERGGRVPDPAPILEACLAAVYAAARARRPVPLLAGGKSMGGRIASQAAAGGAIDPPGLVFLGYPLHPPGKPAQRRDKHLPAVKRPMLFVHGTRDPFATPDEIAPLVPKLAAGTRLLPIEGGDHSHAVPKRGGVPQEEVYARIADAIVAFAAEVTRR